MDFSEPLTWVFTLAILVLLGAAASVAIERYVTDKKHKQHNDRMDELNEKSF
jgi:uncharacterized BrkB/YihY/UPF0761 family membrane protein